MAGRLTLPKSPPYLPEIPHESKFCLILIWNQLVVKMKYSGPGTQATDGHFPSLPQLRESNGSNRNPEARIQKIFRMYAEKFLDIPL